METENEEKELANDLPVVSDNTGTAHVIDSNTFGLELPPVSETTDDFEGDPEEPDELETGTEFAGETEPQNTLEKWEQYRGQLSDSGDSFDPMLHQCPPSQTKTGKWRNKSKKQRVEHNTETQEKGEEIKPNIAYRREAENYAQLYGTAHTAPFIFGANGAIEDSKDLLPLIDSLERYLMQAGYSELNPKWSVLFSAFNYSAGVCQRKSNIEKTAKFFGGMIDTVKGWLGFNKKKAEKEEVKRA